MYLFVHVGEVAERVSGGGVVPAVQLALQGEALLVHLQRLGIVSQLCISICIDTLDAINRDVKVSKRKG